MLLALDAGNSNITIGAFEDRSLIGRWRLRTVLRQTADEWGILLRNLFSLSGLDLAKVQGIIISSVRGRTAFSSVTGAWSVTWS